jgi:hypothetical protein
MDPTIYPFVPPGDPNYVSDSELAGLFKTLDTAAAEWTQARTYWQSLQTTLTEYLDNSYLPQVNSLLSSWQGTAADEFHSRATLVHSFGRAIAAQANRTSDSASGPTFYEFSDAVVRNLAPVRRLAALAAGSSYDSTAQFDFYTSFLSNVYRQAYNNYIYDIPITVPSWPEWVALLDAGNDRQTMVMNANPDVYQKPAVNKPSAPSEYTGVSQQTLARAASIGNQKGTSVAWLERGPDPNNTTNVVAHYLSSFSGLNVSLPFNYDPGFLGWNNGADDTSHQDSLRNVLRPVEFPGFLRALIGNLAVIYSTMVLQSPIPVPKGLPGAPQSSPTKSTSNNGTNAGGLTPFANPAGSPAAANSLKPNVAGSPTTGMAGTGASYTPPKGTSGPYTPISTGSSPGSYTPGTYDPGKAGGVSVPGLDSGKLASFTPSAGSGFGGLGGGGLGGASGLGGADGGLGAGAGGVAGGAGAAGAGAAGMAARSGMPMAPMGAGAGSGKDGKERPRKAYLNEDDDVWGADGGEAPAVL